MASPDEFLEAVRRGDLHAVTAYVTGGSDMNVRDPNGMTALILSVDRGHHGVLRLLLAHNAPTDLADKWGQTALGYAVENHKSDVAAILKKACAQ